MKRTISIDTYMMMQATILNEYEIKDAKIKIDGMLRLNEVEVGFNSYSIPAAEARSCESCRHTRDFREFPCNLCNPSFDKWEKP